MLLFTTVFVSPFSEIKQSKAATIPPTEAAVLFPVTSTSTLEDPEFSLSVNTTGNTSAYVEEYKLGIWSNAENSKKKSLSGTIGYFLKLGKDFNYYVSGGEHRLRLRLEGSSGSAVITCYSNEFQLKGIKNTPLFNISIDITKTDELSLNYEYDNYKAKDDIRINIEQYIPKSKSWSLIKGLLNTQKLTTPKIFKEEKTVPLKIANWGILKITLPATPYSNEKVIMKTITKTEKPFVIKKKIQTKKKITFKDGKKKFVIPLKLNKKKTVLKKGKRKITIKESKTNFVVKIVVKKKKKNREKTIKIDKKKVVKKTLILNISATQNIKNGTITITTTSPDVILSSNSTKVKKIKTIKMKKGKAKIKLNIDGKTIDKKTLKKGKYYLSFKPTGLKTVTQNSKNIYFIKGSKIDIFTKIKVKL
ncbi:MAG: hypothetical protein LBD41_00060 [Clostridiales Family XIII bacterium]|jgi:hypothetical protein|nr:hypothetical protein [Clostridiales Family XIII bacterium]